MDTKFQPMPPSSLVSLGAAGGLVWWTAVQQSHIGTNTDNINRLEKAIYSMDTPLGSTCCGFKRTSLSLFNEQLTTNKELAEKIVKQQEENTRTLNEIKESVKKR